MTDAYYKRFEGNMQTFDMCNVDIYDHKLLQEFKDK